MAKEQMTEDIIMEKKDIGEVKIASDVVSVIAALAATEVECINSAGAPSIIDPVAGSYNFDCFISSSKFLLVNFIKIHNLPLFCVTRL